MERCEWLKLQEDAKKDMVSKYVESGSPVDRELKTIALLAEVCEQLWKLRKDQP